MELAIVSNVSTTVQSSVLRSRFLYSVYRMIACTHRNIIYDTFTLYILAYSYVRLNLRVCIVYCKYVIYIFITLMIICHDLDMIKDKMIWFVKNVRNVFIAV